MVRRTTIFILAILVAIPLAAPAALAGPGEGDMLAKINASRASAGLPALASHGSLVAHARSHSIAMADSDSIWHSSNATLKSLVSGWERIGENVGRGPNVSVLHTAFMNSSGHRANIMGDFTHAGVGTYVTDAGMMYVTVVFVKLAGASPTTTTAPAPTTTTTVAPTPTTVVPAPTTTAPAPKPSPTKSSTTTTVAPAPTTTTSVPDAAPEVAWEQIHKRLPGTGLQDRQPCVS